MVFGVIEIVKPRSRNLKMEGKATEKRYVITEENIEVIIKHLTKIVSELTCSICSGLFLDPITLSCGHTFCNICLAQLESATSQSRTRTSCPTCKKRINKRKCGRKIDSDFLNTLKALIKKIEESFKTSLDKIEEILSKANGVEKLTELINAPLVNEMKSKKSPTNNRRNAALNRSLRKTKSLDCIAVKVDRSKSRTKRHSINNLEELLTQQELFNEKCANIPKVLEEDYVEQLNKEFGNTADTGPSTSKPAPKSTKATAKKAWSRIKKMTRSLDKKRKQPERLCVTSEQQPKKKPKGINVNPLENCSQENLDKCTVQENLSLEKDVIEDTISMETTSTLVVVPNTADGSEMEQELDVERNTNTPKKAEDTSSVTKKTAEGEVQSVEEFIQDTIENCRSMEFERNDSKRRMVIPKPSKKTEDTSSVPMKSTETVRKVQSVEEFFQDTIANCRKLAKRTCENSQFLNHLAEYIEKNQQVSFVHKTDKATETEKILTSTTGIQTEETLKLVQTDKIPMKDVSTQIELFKTVPSIKNVPSPSCKKDASTQIELFKNVLSPIRQNVTNPTVKENAKCNKENKQQSYKRIRPLSDSDSDENSAATKSKTKQKKIEILDPKELSIAFCSENESCQVQNDESDENYDEILQEALNKCDQDLEYNEANLQKRPPKPLIISSSSSFGHQTPQQNLPPIGIINQTTESEEKYDEILQEALKKCDQDLEYNEANLKRSSKPLISSSSSVEHQTPQGHRTDNLPAIGTINQTELEEMFLDDFRFTEASQSLPNKNSAQVQKLRDRKEELKARRNEAILSCTAANLEDFFNEPFDVSKETPNLVEGTEFTCKIQTQYPVQSSTKASFSHQDSDKTQMTLSEQVGRESPTLFSPCASDDDEVTMIERTPPRSCPKFVLPPLPEEESGGKESRTLPEPLLSPPKEFIDAKVTSTQVDESGLAIMMHTCDFSAIEKGAPKSVNPILSTINDEHCPLTIVKAMPSVCEGLRPSQTKTQSSILNFVVVQKPCIACTRLSKDQIMAINGLCSKKLATYSKDYSSSTTHMIVQTSEDGNRVKDHTIKYLSAVAAGKWILSFGWIQECLDQGMIVSEEPYEILDVSGAPGPRISRNTRLSNPLLRNYIVHCAPPFETTTLRDLEEVIRNLGGKIAYKPEELTIKKTIGCVCLIITEARITQDFEQYEEWLERFGVVSVDLEWLSRSVGQYKAISVRPFILCSEDNLESLGYPEELLTYVPESQSTSD